MDLGIVPPEIYVIITLLIPGLADFNFKIQGVYSHEPELEKQETNCIQAGYAPKNGDPRMIPIVQSTTFRYDSSARMGALFDLEESGYFYTRLPEPHQ